MRLVPSLPHRRRCPSAGRAFGWTLFELLIVLALLSIVAAISLPSFLRAVRKSPLRQAMSDLEEVCNNARMMAILEGRPAEVVIRAADGTMQARLLQERAPSEEEAEEEAPVVPLEGDETPPAPASSSRVQPMLTKLPPTVAFKKLMVNLEDLMDSEEARVRFRPNSTCDAFSATLLSEDSEERSITFEITTARGIVEVIR